MWVWEVMNSQLLECAERNNLLFPALMIGGFWGKGREASVISTVISTVNSCCWIPLQPVLDPLVGQCWKAVYAHTLLCWKASLIRGFSFSPWYFTALTLADPRGRWLLQEQPEGKVPLTWFSAGQRVLWISSIHRFATPKQMRSLPLFGSPDY